MLRLALLGAPEIHLDVQSVDGFSSGKAKALLYYLAHNPGVHARERLATLFWGDMADRNAMTNLRNVLANLNKLLGTYVETTRQTAAFNHRAPHWLDVAAWQKILDEPVRGDSLARARALYRGEFLTGFNLRGADLFDEWLTATRVELHQRWIDGLLGMAVAYRAQDELVLGLEAADKILELEPWHEPACQIAMDILVRSGRRGEASARYRALEAALEAEFGLEPGAELTAVQMRLVTVTAPIPTNLPPERDIFVGRHTETDAICRSLNDPSCRLITILGIGGSGKSRLAEQAARRFLSPGFEDIVFADGIYEVLLERIHEHRTVPDDNDQHALMPGTAMILAIANAIGLRPRGGSPLRDQLIDTLREQCTLLILDNFEHLLRATPRAAIAVVNDILTHAPAVKLLVTSRARLNLAREWLFPLDGLAQGDGTTSTRVENSAAQLFIERARRIRHDFTPNAAEMKNIGEICRLVDGLPLAIELAASWLRVLSCADIAAEIRRSLDILKTQAHDVPERHRSLRAVFDSSWEMLDAQEQATLCRLSIFRGPYRRDAALHVADADLAMLVALADKSWLRHLGYHHYRLQELMRQFAEERRLDMPEVDRAIRRSHAEFYARWAHALLPQLRGEQISGIEELTHERENVRVAWLWALEHEAVDLLELMLEPVFFYFLATGGYAEGAQAFLTSAEIVAARYSGLAGTLLTLQSIYLIGRGDIDQAEIQLFTARSLLAEAGSERSRARSLLAQAEGRIAQMRGELDRARALVELSAALQSELGDELAVAFSQTDLGDIALDAGDLAAARAWAHKAQAAFHALNQPLGLAITLNLMGRVEHRAGETALAERHFRESLAAFHALEDNPRRAESLLGLALLALDREELPTARSYLQQALAIAVKAEFHHLIFTILAAKIRLAQAEDRHADAARIALVLRHAAEFAGFDPSRLAGLTAGLELPTPPRYTANLLPDLLTTLLPQH